MPAQSPVDLAAEPFVSLTTFRRSGAGVPTPVWVVADGDALVVWTGGSSGKVKRLRADPRVDLVPCSRRGRVDDAAPHVAGRAEVSRDAAVLGRVERALKAKYGLQHRLITLIERVARRGDRDRVALVIRAA